MDPQGSKMKEDPKHYRTSHRIKGMIELFAFYYILEWINIMISIIISIILNLKSLLTLIYLG
jgi:hypothetical protein